MLDRMAALALQSIQGRAFTAAGVAKSVSGMAVRPLTQAYAWYKSGTRPYVSEASRARARTRRGFGSGAQSARDRNLSRLAARLSGSRPVIRGPAGEGPIVYAEGGRRRLTPRAPIADQRLSDGTFQALGVVRQSDDSRTIGFRTERAQRTAAFLQERNQFFPLSAEEARGVVEIGAAGAIEAIRRFRLDDGRIEVIL